MLAKYSYSMLLLVATVIANLWILQIDKSAATSMVVLGVWFGQLGLLATWAVVGEGAKVGRWGMLAVATLLAPTVWLTWVDRRVPNDNSLLYLWIFLFHVLLVLFAVAILARFLPVALGTDDTSRRLRPGQFSIRHMFVVTTATALLLVMVQWILSYTDVGDVFPLLPICSLLAVGAFICFRLIRPFHIRIAAILVLGLIVAAGANSFLGRNIWRFIAVQGVVYAIWLGVVSIDLRRIAASDA
jgi:hypothetical protein